MTFPPEAQPVVDELLPLCRALGEGARAVSIGGSYGKGTFDPSSDLDFRLFCERRLSPPEAFQQAYAQVQAAIDRWAEKGVIIDGCWVRTTGEIDAQIDAWCNGAIATVDRVWTIWGYYVLTDVYNQMVIDDRDGILAGWRARLSTYPPQLKHAVLDKHLKSVRYWRQDYHYQHKVERGDVVFLASLTARLVHDLIQILFALNETYYAGDGNNLTFIEHFDCVPEGFVEKVDAILYPGTGDGALRAQYDRMCALIDATMALAEGSPEL
ncbi:MAG: DUF4037 domain-containing protein [Anaerolineae bacterium]|nr:DUF4037 domain-containing protein [Anaerolineae bacterium]